jgi:hypothetical protein
VEFATLQWVNWFNNRRLLEPIGNIPPAEAEARYYEKINGLARGFALGISLTSQRGLARLGRDRFYLPA